MGVRRNWHWISRSQPDIHSVVSLCCYFKTMDSFLDVSISRPAIFYFLPANGLSHRPFTLENTLSHAA